VGLIKTGLLVSVVTLTVSLVTVRGSQNPVFPDCLNVSSPQNPFRPKDHAICVKDVLNFGDDKTVRADEKLLGITPQEVRFIGCSEAPFVTFPALGLSDSSYTIYYPTGVQLAHEDYLAPFLHEMGHVFQLKQAGSYPRLEAALDNSLERIELGADFLAGIGADRLGLEPKAFLVNLSLFGSYNSSGVDYHGRPEDRAVAFRNGFFYQEKRTTITASYADFQDNLFAQIKDM
jgi:hypothetical protein